ncbi:ankyrin repeat-containing domain protein [Fusarium sp. MPI-SDFR-AT-0072]|nr:ankyrin repeat-containing domain protein [Fusarium sp. MPI-SDFR-AT-0072]
MTLKTLFAHAERQPTSSAPVPLAEMANNTSNSNPTAGAKIANNPDTTRAVPSPQTAAVNQPKLTEANPNTVENLVSAAKKNDSVKVLELLDQKVPIDGKNGGWTALGCAAHEGQLDTVRVLLIRGADMDIRMDVGFGVLPGDGSAINWAACGGYLDVVKILLEKGAKSNICAKRPVFLGTGGTPITMAAGKGHLEVVRYLLENGCDDDSVDGIPGWDAFIVACERGQPNIIKYLVDEKELNVDRNGSNGVTPLITAAQSQQTAAMEYLVNRGARIDAVDNDGSTALLHAVMKKRVGAVEWLVKRGADSRKKNKKGVSPLNLAREELQKNADDKNAATMVKWLEVSMNVAFQIKA